MKNRIKAFLQAVLGYDRYLRFFAWFKVRTLRWDRQERDFFYFLARLPEDGVALDVGANLGFLCVHLARQVAQGSVIAFEPRPDSHRVLRRMIRRFGLHNVEIYPWAVGDRNGSVPMVLPMQGSARPQGPGHVAVAGQKKETGAVFEVPIRRLDDVPEVNNPWTRIAAIKIDVENFELHVLRGAMEIIERDRPLIYLELRNNENRHECFAVAERLNYQVKVFDGIRLVPFEPVGHRDYGNFFFVPASGPRRARGLVSAPGKVQASEDSRDLQRAWGFDGHPR
jgi:FkbM family methyltransferase